jgi:hypothetical protein
VSFIDLPEMNPFGVRNLPAVVVEVDEPPAPRPAAPEGPDLRGHVAEAPAAQVLVERVA